MADDCGAMPDRPCGLETEFGMMLRGGKALDAAAEFVGKFNPAWLGSAPQNFAWDSKARIAGEPDSRDHSFFKDPAWLRRLNFILPNAARFYLDGGHAEISTPLCLSGLELLRWNRACYALIDTIRKNHQERFGTEYTIYRNNVAIGDPECSIGLASGQKRVSFACHENYSTWRRVPLDTLLQRLGFGFFPARIMIIGAGKVGSDYGMPWADFQISQRADFFTRTQALETTQNRPIYNTRDVPYADWHNFRRVHVICGDSNMLPLPEFLKVTLTDIALKMIEDEVLPNTLEFLNPVSAIKSISRDLECVEVYSLAHAKERRGILDILSTYRDWFGDYIAARWGHDESLKLAVDLFSQVIERLRARDEEALYGKLDWVTKKIIINRYLSAKGLSWISARAIELDCKYADNDHARGIVFRKFPNSENEFFTREERTESSARPPNSRSRWIFEILRRYHRFISSSNYWDSIIARDPIAPGLGRNIFFPDPRVKYDPELAERVFQLSFADCVIELIKLGLAEAQFGGTYD